MVVTTRRKKRTTDDSEDNRESQKDVSKCDCDCQNGVIRLSDTPIVEPDVLLIRCQCRECGPMQGDGKRRCVIRLNLCGVLISRAMDGRIVCFDCRGYE